MTTASSPGQRQFSLGRRRRSPGLLDQLGWFFGGDRRRKAKGSFRGHLSSSPQRPLHFSASRRRNDNAVVHFFKSIVSPPRPKSRWRGLSLTRLGWGERKERPLSALFYDSAKTPHKSQRDRRGNAPGTLSKIFRLGRSRSGSPSKR
ncbi:myelin basic protein-like [Megalops cyprinoides]|uniref:myelin basic protein-like n=1 Tax=Megalops cyprinoides TaxID=118141 RepID=UPI001863DC26|nr:myelin basic protein-like [Megalops cyprinoides]